MTTTNIYILLPGSDSFLQWFSRYNIMW